MQPFSCQHREHGIMKFQLYRRLIFPDYNYKDGPLNSLFSFCDAGWVGLKIL
jgi:hypothetical protein